MTALIKNHNHSSHTYLLIEDDKKTQESWIIKSSSDQEGIIDINQELIGIDWYKKQIKNNLKYNVVVKHKHYIRVKHKMLSGNIPQRRKKSYQSNIFYISPVISHYCDVWKLFVGKKSAPIHGDLSIFGNIIFEVGNSPIFIDWEHFQYEGGPIGFDALYFLFELLWFEILNNNVIYRQSIEHLAQMIKTLKQNHCLDEFYFDAPLESMNYYMRSNKHYWREQYRKMPNLLFKNHDVKKIDRLLKKYI